MTAELKTNKIYGHLNNSKRIVLEQGGARSGKTYNILIWFILKLLKENNKVLTIVRATMPSLKGTVLRDFIEILDKLGLYSEKYHNKTDNNYLLNGNIIEFLSVDQYQKIKGRKRDYLFCNEANELDYDEWYQLLIRTSDKIVLDYNPSISEDHWLLTSVKTHPDCDFYITSYLDNPFLDVTIKNEIERLQHTDSTLWNIYGLGQRSDFKGLIFQNWNYGHTVEGKPIYGLDFGFSIDPCALVELRRIDNNIYIHELIYQTHLTNSDLINKFKVLGIRHDAPIYADSSEPKSIVELSRAGYNVKPAKKGADSIKQGIDILKRFNLIISKESINICKELRNYKFQEINGKLTDKILDINNHTIDAIRYAASMEYGIDMINRFKPAKVTLTYSR